VLEVLKEQKTMSQIASDFGIHVNQLRQWREIAMENWPHTFEPQGVYSADSLFILDMVRDSFPLLLFQHVRF